MNKLNSVTPSHKIIQNSSLLSRASEISFLRIGIPRDCKDLPRVEIEKIMQKDQRVKNHSSMLLQIKHSLRLIRHRVKTTK